MVGGGWRLAVGGWRRLVAVGGWRRLVAVGGWRRLVVGGWWSLGAVLSQKKMGSFRTALPISRPQYPQSTALAPDLRPHARALDGRVGRQVPGARLRVPAVAEGLGALEHPRHAAHRGDPDQPIGLPHVDEEEGRPRDDPEVVHARLQAGPPVPRAPRVVARVQVAVAAGAQAQVLVLAVPLGERAVADGARPRALGVEVADLELRREDVADRVLAEAAEVVEGPLGAARAEAVPQGGDQQQRAGGGEGEEGVPSGAGVHRQPEEAAQGPPEAARDVDVGHEEGQEVARARDVRGLGGGVDQPQDLEVEDDDAQEDAFDLGGPAQP